MQFGLGFSILCVYKMNTYAINIQLHWELMVLLKVFHPAGQERDGCYFLNDQKGTKESLGAASGEHLACGGAHSHCPQTPITRGRPPEDLAFASGGSKHKILHPSCLGPLGPTYLKFKKAPLKWYRLVQESCGSWSVFGHAPFFAQPPPHQTGRWAPGGVR